jgi:hypothetical protein
MEPLAVRSARLLDLDPELVDGMPRELVERLRPYVHVSAIELPPGELSSHELKRAADGADTLIVVKGLVLRETVIAGVAATAILGPSDLMRVPPPDVELMPVEVRWAVAAAAVVVPIDGQLLAQLRNWPGLGARLLSRASAQARRQATLRAIVQLPRVELRVLGLLWHFAERWGHVGRAGVIVPMAFTHAMLGRLVGARRPTITLALGALAERGHVTRRDDGSWVLSHESLASLRTEGELPATLTGIGETAPLATAAPAARGSNTSAERAALSTRIARLRKLQGPQEERVRELLDRCDATRHVVINARIAREQAEPRRRRN